MLIQTQPIVDLHRHLDGNINVSTICELAHKFAVKLPSYEPSTLARYCQINDRTSDLLSFLKKLDYGVSVLGDYEACKRVAFENVEDAYRQGLHYVELRFSPNYMAKAFSLDLDKVVEAVIEGVDKGRREFPIVVNLIGILSRSYGIKECSSELSAILNTYQQFVAVDLAGDELGFPADLFETHFEKVKAAGLKVTIHAGEADGPESIWNAIEKLGASRIGHGVAAIKDARLRSYMKSKNIGIEACLTSNYQTGTFTDIANHPIKVFLHEGLAVSLNTDDPAVSNIDIKSEYELAMSTIGFNEKEINQLKINGFNQAFMTSEQRSRVLQLV